MKRIFEDSDNDLFDNEPKWKKRKIDEVQYDFSELSMDKNAFNDNIQIFCSNSIENELTKKDLFINSKAQIKIRQDLEFKDVVYCDANGYDTYQIKHALRKCGFIWDRKAYRWEIKKDNFVLDYDLFIGKLLSESCKYHNLSLFVFDFKTNEKRKRILYKAINTRISYDKKKQNIYVSTNKDEEDMIELLQTLGYKFDKNIENGWFVYKKSGILYQGHIEEWKELAICNKLIIGYDIDEIVPTPSCIKCKQKLILHRIKKKGSKYIGRKFYNCMNCYHQKRGKTSFQSFLWADGRIQSKISELSISENLTQPLSQMTI